MSYSKYSVLIVDDHATMRQITQTLLKQIGFLDLDQAPDGKAALAAMKGKRYDLIVSDWNMPVMDGLEFLKTVRTSEDPQVKAVPFILITAEAKPENILSAKQAGVNNYIVKPFNAETLKKKINMTLGIM